MFLKFFWMVSAFLFFFEILTLAQEQNIIVESQINSDNTASFRFTKRDFGTFYLEVIFKSLENANSTGYKGNIDSSSGNLFSIKSTDPRRSMSFSYNTTWIRGTLNARIDSNFVYLLPVSAEKTCSVYSQNFLYTQYFGAEKPRRWKSFQFNVNEGDTVFAARKGLVVEVIDGFTPDTAIIFSNKANAVIIEHEDGSLARYGVLKSGSIGVKPGDVVFPHTPLAIAGTYNEARRTQISFMVYYLTAGDFNSGKNSLVKMKHYYSCVNPVFHTTAGNVQLKGHEEYTCNFLEEHITREMTKKEKRKFDEAHKLK